MPQVAAELHSRPPFERMMRIHDSLKAGRYPNCTQLAAAIEVSTRTIKRDVDFMKFRLDLPIEYDAKRYGYYYSDAVEKFPNVPVTEALIVPRSLNHCRCNVLFHHDRETDDQGRQCWGRACGRICASPARTDPPVSTR